MDARLSQKRMVSKLFQKLLRIRKGVKAETSVRISDFYELQKMVKQINATKKSLKSNEANLEELIQEELLKT